MKKIVSVLLAMICLISVASCLAETPKAGDIVTFGHFDQDKNSSNGKEAIEWIVLETDGETAFLLSRYVLDARAYHSSNGKNDWSKSKMRSWLNKTFLEKAFSNKEQKAIVTTTLDNRADQSKSKEINGKETKDKVFLLSYAELEKYFPDQESRKAVYTDTALNAYSDGSMTFAALKEYFQEYYGGCREWYLRTAEINMFSGYYSPDCVDRDGEMTFIGVTPTLSKGVRPAIVVNLSKAGSLLTVISSGN